MQAELSINWEDEGTIIVGGWTFPGPSLPSPRLLPEGPIPRTRQGEVRLERGRKDPWGGRKVETAPGPRGFRVLCLKTVYGGACKSQLFIFPGFGLLSLIS